MFVVAPPSRSFARRLQFARCRTARVCPHLSGSEASRTAGSAPLWSESQRLSPCVRDPELGVSRFQISRLRVRFLPGVLPHLALQSRDAPSRGDSRASNSYTTSRNVLDPRGTLARHISMPVAEMCAFHGRAFWLPVAASRRRARTTSPRIAASRFGYPNGRLIAWRV